MPLDIPIIIFYRALVTFVFNGIVKYFGGYIR